MFLSRRARVCARVSFAQATQRHFDDLRRRYGPPTVCLNLLKSKERRPRETILRRELGVAIALLNKRVRLMGALQGRLLRVQWAGLGGAGRGHRPAQQEGAHVGAVQKRPLRVQ